MILQKKTINNVPTLVPLTADTGSGVPVGTIIGQYKKVNMSGYLYLDGSTFDQTLYPALYAYLGTNVLPDYREFVLVGAEQNTTSATIAAHDVFTQGEEKDDQLQNHSHRIPTNNNDVGASKLVREGASLSEPYSIRTTDIVEGRHGNTTRTKEKAVFWYIKATTGIIESEATEMLNVFNNRMFPDYAHQITISAGTTTWTATEDCYVVIGQINTSRSTVLIDGVAVSANDESQGASIAHFSGYLRKGQTIYWEYLDHTSLARIFPLTN